MIPAQNLIAWGSIVPWADSRQVEQDLIISRALVSIFSNSMLSQELRFRGGTALNKLHFPVPLRYSEDIDLVRTSSGPIGPLLDQLRTALEPWLGQARFDQSPIAPKLYFHAQAQAGGPPIRVKLEINTREIQAYDKPLALPLRVSNPWFSGEALIATFSQEEMLATKLRALLQRDKGRDLFDLAHALNVFSALSTDRVTELCGQYMRLSGQTITRAQAQKRMFEKLANPRFLLDMKPLLSADQAEKLDEKFTKNAFLAVFTLLIDCLPGDPWAKTGEMKDKFGLMW